MACAPNSARHNLHILNTPSQGLQHGVTDSLSHLLLPSEFCWMGSGLGKHNGSFLLHLPPIPLTSVLPLVPTPASPLFILTHLIPFWHLLLRGLSSEHVQAPLLHVQISPQKRIRNSFTTRNSAIGLDLTSLFPGYPDSDLPCKEMGGDSRASDEGKH